MKYYISLSKYPGTTGEYFYNNFFKHYNINAEYKAHQCYDIGSSIKQAAQNNLTGISVSMPYKKTVIPYLNDITADCATYQSCNTVINNNGRLTGHNSDLSGVKYTCEFIETGDSITVLGDGAMASMYIKYLKDFNVTQCARKLKTWDLRHASCDVIINATGMGTSIDQSPCDHIPSNTRLVIDLSVKQGQLNTQCQASGIKYIGGREFYKEQFKVQFKIYTGVEIDDHVYDKFDKAFFK